MIIYKHRLSIQGPCDIRVPVDAKILDIKDQHGDVYLWALADPSNSLVSRTIRMFFTGEELPNTQGSLKYLKTVHLPDRGLVLHFFEEIHR